MRNHALPESVIENKARSKVLPPENIPFVDRLFSPLNREIVVGHIDSAATLPASSFVTVTKRQRWGTRHSARAKVCSAGTGEGARPYVNLEIVYDFSWASCFFTSAASL